MKTKIKFLAMMLMGIMLSTNVWGEIATGTYVLCTSTSDLKAGDHYIIANGTSGEVKCISNVENSNNRKEVAATVTDSKITVDESSTIMTFTLGGSTGSWTFQTDNYAGTNGYLASAASGDNNYCRVLSTSTTATISFNNDVAVINLQPHASRTQLSYNSGSSLFACYSGGQSAVYLYHKSSAPASPCTVTFNAGTGRCSKTELTETSAGAGVTLPTAQASVGCAAIGWTFAGWATATQPETTTAPTLYAADSNYKPSTDCPLYAVYSLTPSSPAGAAAVGTVLWSEDWSGESPLNNYDKSDGFEGSIQSGTMSAGRTEPELLLKSYDAVTTKSAINLQGAKTLEATLYSNRNYIKINGNAGTNVADTKQYKYKWTVEESVTSINITIASNGNDNARIDDITLKVAAPDVTYNSNPECAAPVRISWRVQSDQYAEDEINTQVTIVPANPDPAEYSCGENAVFVGWTTSDNYSNHSTAPTPLYKTAAEIKALVLIENITFYAVFATKVINN